MCPWDYPRRNTGAGCHFLLQGIFPTQSALAGGFFTTEPPGKPLELINSANIYFLHSNIHTHLGKHSSRFSVIACLLSSFCFKEKPIPHPVYLTFYQQAGLSSQIPLPLLSTCNLAEKRLGGSFRSRKTKRFRIRKSGFKIYHYQPCNLGPGKQPFLRWFIFKMRKILFCLTILVTIKIIMKDNSDYEDQSGFNSIALTINISSSLLYK